MIKITTPFYTNAYATKVISNSNNSIEILGVDDTDQYKYTSIYQYNIENNEFETYSSKVMTSSLDIDVPIYQVFPAFADNNYNYIAYISDNLNNIYWLELESRNLIIKSLSNISSDAITSNHFKMLSNPEATSFNDNNFYTLGAFLNTVLLPNDEQWVIGENAVQTSNLLFSYDPTVSKVVKINNDYYVLGGFSEEVDGQKLFYKVTKDVNGYNFTERLADLPISIPTTLNLYDKVIIFSFNNKIYFYNKGIDENNFYVYDLSTDIWIQYPYLGSKIFNYIASDSQVIEKNNLFYIFNGNILYILNQEEMNPNFFNTTSNRIIFIKNELIKIKNALKSKGMIMPNRLDKWASTIENYEIADVSGITATENDVREDMIAYTVNGLQRGTLEVGETVSLFTKSSINITHIQGQSGTEDIKITLGFEPRLLIIYNDKFNTEAAYPSGDGLYPAIYKNSGSYPKYGYFILYNRDYNQNAAVYKIKYKDNYFSGIVNINTGSKPAFKSRAIIKSIDSDGFTLNFSGVDTKEKSDYAYLFNGFYTYIAVG